MRAAFSLIELLVVIVIVAVLAGLLLPAVRVVRDQSRGSVCASNQRQLGMAFMAYRSEWEGMLPPAVQYRGPLPTFFYWYQAIRPVLDDGSRDPSSGSQSTTRAQVCPETCFPALAQGAWFGAAMSYGFNNSIHNWIYPEFVYGLSGHYRNGFVPERLGRPLTRLVLLAERWAAQADGIHQTNDCVAMAPYEQAPMTPPLQPGGYQNALRLAHRGRSTYLFFDGHVETLGPWDGVAAGATTANERTAVPNIWMGN